MPKLALTRFDVRRSRSFNEGLRSLGPQPVASPEAKLLREATELEAIRATLTDKGLTKKAKACLLGIEVKELPHFSELFSHILGADGGSYVVH